MPKLKAATSQIRGSTVLMAGRGLSVGLNFLTQILTVRYLAKADYGALAYALAMASFFAQISRFGMDKAISRFAAIQDEREQYGRMFGTLAFACGLVLACGATLTAAVLALGDSLGTNIVSDPLSLHLLLILIALAPIDGLDYVLQSVFATFSKPKLIVFRKYVVGPALKFLAIVGVMVAAADVRTLAFARLGASVLGLLIAASLLGKVLRERDLLGHFGWKAMEIRAKEIMSYSLPMLGSDAVLLLRGALIVFFLEYFQGSVSVADFRSVLPVARLNNVALDSFAFLFVPAVARLTASPDDGSLNDMYWRSATWVTVLSLPVFLVTFALAGPMTVTLFGDRYVDAAPVLALLSAGAFLHASMAMSGLVLKAAGRVKNVLTVDGSALAIEIVLIALLIPRYGALGGAVAYAVTSAAHAAVYHLVLVRKMDVRLVPVGFGRVYASIGSVAAVALVFSLSVEPSLWLGVTVVGGLWLFLLLRVAHDLDFTATFPELARIPVVGTLLERSERRSRDALAVADREEEISRMLRSHAGSLQPELGPPPHRVRPVATRVRATSTLMDFDLEGDDGRVPVLVKARWNGRADETAAPDLPTCPRIGRSACAGVIIDGERTTLRAVQEMLSALDDPRFEAVRVMESVALPGVVAMERLTHPTLRDLLHRACRTPWSRPGPELLRACANAGAWLRTFQSLEPFEHTERRHADRSAFLAQMNDFADYLSGSGADQGLVGDAHRCAVATAESVLPEQPPCGLGHGDYAARNVLVAPGGRVAVIDTPGRWIFPVYLDLGYFLSDLRTSWMSACTRCLLPRADTLEAVESAFLRGYFRADPIARREVRLFELFALVARWASTVHTMEGGGAGLMRRTAARMRDQAIRRRLRSTLSDLQDTGPTVRPSATQGLGDALITSPARS